MPQSASLRLSCPRMCHRRMAAPREALGRPASPPPPVRRGDQGPGPDPPCGIMVGGAGAEARERARNGRVGKETGDGTEADGRGEVPGQPPGRVRLGGRVPGHGQGRVRRPSRLRLHPSRRGRGAPPWLLGGSIAGIGPRPRPTAALVAGACHAPAGPPVRGTARPPDRRHPGAGRPGELRRPARDRGHRDARRRAFARSGAPLHHGGVAGRGGRGDARQAGGAPSCPGWQRAAGGRARGQ